jgi:hypothetical protein
MAVVTPENQAIKNMSYCKPCTHVEYVMHIFTWCFVSLLFREPIGKKKSGKAKKYINISV